MSEALDPTVFVGFPKLTRLSKGAIITEKLDGTNAQILIMPDGLVVAGSRNRYLTVDDDNFGFAKWVKANEEELRAGLGVGRHFGEWWGLGIQRGYGLQEKRFSSVASPGFMNPEGVVVFAGGALFKKTFGGDGHKGQS